MCVWNTECFQKSFVLIFMCDFVVTGMYVFLMRVKICVKITFISKKCTTAIPLRSAGLYEQYTL